LAPTSDAVFCKKYEKIKNFKSYDFSSGLEIPAGTSNIQIERNFINNNQVVFSVYLLDLVF